MVTKLFARIVAGLLLVPLIVGTATAEYSLKWSYDAGEHIRYAYSQGIYNWSDINGDSYPDVVVYYDSGNVSFDVLDGRNGLILWTSPMGVSSWTYIAGISLADADAQPEVLVARIDYSGPDTVWIIDGLSGVVEWSYTGDSIRVVQFSDVDNDGISEILISDGSQVKCFQFTGSVGVNDDSNDSEQPRRFQLAQNYPNPFNSGTIIEYLTPESGHVKIQIYNTLGQLVNTVFDDFVGLGQHQAFWNGSNSAGQRVASGVYFYTVETDAGGQSKKMIVLR